MGFRNPITSAVALDTGATAPGVKVYANNSNPGSGVVEWDAYTAKVTGSLTSSQTGSGGSYFTLGMNNNGPSLAMNIEGQPAGGTASVLRLTADRIIPSAVYLCQAIATVAQPIAATGWTALAMGKADLNSGGFTISGSRITVPVDGIYELTGMCVFAANATGYRALRWNWTLPPGGTQTTPLVVAWEPAAASGNPAVVARPTIAQLSAGGWCELQAAQASGAALNTQINSDGAPSVAVKLIAAL